MFFNIFFILIIFTSYGQSSPVVRGQDVCDKTLPSPIQCSKRVDDLPTNRNNQLRPASFPYMVFVEPAHPPLKDGTIPTGACGGILVKPDIVLTAGHCLDFTGSVIKSIAVAAGIVDLNRDRKVAQFVSAKAYKVHKGFAAYKKKLFRKAYYMTNDLAVIWLSKPFTINARVQLAQLPNNFNINGVTGISLGWGTNEKGHNPSILQKVELQVIKNPECKKLLKDISVSDQSFCVISEDRRCGVSFGDSGGPFSVGKTVYGLVSYGQTYNLKREEDGEVVPVCDPKYPQIFTNLHKYDSWIKKTLKGQPPSKKCKTYEKSCAL